MWLRLRDNSPPETKWCRRLTTIGQHNGLNKEQKKIIEFKQENEEAYLCKKQIWLTKNHLSKKKYQAIQVQLPKNLEGPFSYWPWSWT